MSNYLTTQGEFEKALHPGGVFQVPSARLTRLKTAIKLYIPDQKPEHLKDVNDKFSAWRHNDHNEFLHWFGFDAGEEFEQELEAAFEGEHLVGRPDQPIAGPARPAVNFPPPERGH